MNISRSVKLAGVVLFFLVAISVVVFELSTYLDSQHTIMQNSNIPAEPIAIRPGEIQHIITKLEPIVPSGTVLDIDSNSSKTIQSVIDSAKPGDMVLVKSGIYAESLNLKDGIILQGEDGNNVIIEGDMRIAPVLQIDNCRNVQVSKLTLKHFNQIPEEYGTSKGRWPVVQIDNSGAALDHLIVCNSASDGIKIKNDSVHLDHVIVADCTVYNNLSTGILVLGNGNVELKNNTCIDNKRNGIWFKDYTDGIVTGNICKSNLYNGISIQDNATVNTFQNICTNSQYAGIWYGSNSPFDVKDNNCFDNGSSGIDIRGQISVSAIENICSRNAINGIYLQNGVSGNVSGNVCAENGWHGISADQYSVPHVDNNKCFKNKRSGIYGDVIMLGQNKIYDNHDFNWQEVHTCLQTEDFNELEKMASRIRNEKRHFTNGNWQLDSFYASFGYASGSGPKRFDDNIRLIEKWISKDPVSIAPRIALATAIYKQAWSIRGGGYSLTVSPEAWQPFEQSLLKALDVLKEAEKLDANDPALYTTWISVATGLHNIEEIETAFKKGIEIEPTYYPLYYYHCFAYLPKWYGEPGQYEQLAAEAADLTKNKIGESMYFLLARAMTHQVKDVNEFKESGFDYNRIKRGQKDFTKQFPDFLDIETSNRLCFMACAAGDKESAKDYFIDIGNNWNEKVWRNFETFEKYKTWVRNRDD